MKSSQLTNFLMGLAAISAVATLALCVTDVVYTRQFRAIQVRVQQINLSRAVATSFLTELSEYAKKNPSIQPLLQSEMARPAAQQPASK
jgi:hypothetical protein